jgi:aminoglycoside 6'-N-acetyltransferase
VTGLDVGFRPVTPDDFPQLRAWLAEPHVARWWNHETSAEAVERDFGPVARGEEPAEDLMALLDGVPVGLVQRALWHDHPAYVEEIESIVSVPEGAITIDYLIGESARTGQGLGGRIVRAAVADTWRRYPRSTSVIVPVVAVNRASWRVLEKAGFRRIASGDLEPDNPVDPPLHHVYRIDRDDGDGAVAP